MQKIKSIQKGTGEDSIYYTLPRNKFEEEHTEPSYIVDEIQKNIVDKELIYDENWYPKGAVQHYVYQGHKDGKLVFEMFNPDLVTYE